MRPVHVAHKDVHVGVALELLGAQHVFARDYDVHNVKVLHGVAEHVLGKLPGHLLLILGRLRVDHQVVAVVGAGHVFHGILELREWNDHPLLAVKERGIVYTEPTLLVEAAEAHGHIVVVFVPDLPRGGIRGAAKVAPVRTPLLHELEDLQPGLVIDYGFLAVIADQLPT